MQSSNETYWSLVIESGWIQSAIWEIDSAEKKAKVLCVSTAAHWESDGDLVTAADSVLSSAASELPDETPEPTKTVFGVSASWVEDGQIKENHIDKIRKLCAELSLEPSGFVVLPEAIAYWVKSNEGSPLNGIVVGIGQENLEISVFKLGNLVGNVVVSRSVSLAEDVIEGLVRFRGIENLPSRILVFDGKEGQLEEAKQSLTGVDWLSPEIGEKVKFLHIPKVEIIEPKEKVLAVCLAGASEIGQAQKVIFAGRTEDEVEAEPPADLQNFEESEVSPEELGFVAGVDIRETPQDSRPTFEPRPVATEPRFIPKIPNFKIASFLGFLKNLHFPRPSFNPPRVGVSKNNLIYLAAIAGVLLVVGFLAWFILPKATVTVFVSPREINANKTITLGSDLASHTETVSVSGNKTISVTGTKTVGDAAKGTVTISRAGEEITLASGTKITDSSGLVFTLDSDTTVPAGDTVSLGTVQANVTAGDIGAEYNLASGTIFTVGDYTKADMSAKNDADFSGGSSQQITAVSAEDRKKAEDKLAIELSDQGRDNIKEKISAEDFLIEESVEATSSSKQFDHKVGDEASNLNLSMTMDVKGQVVSQKDLSKLAMDALKDKVPTGFVLRANQITYEFTLVSGKKYKVKFIANLLPEINTDEIIKKILGKRPSAAEEILSQIPGFVRSEIHLSFKFTPLATLPHLAKNISIEISSEK